MIQVFIKAPIWKTKSIGVNKKIIKDDLMVEILYKTENEERLYPGIYFMHKHRALQYPIQDVSGVKLCIIPIHDFIVLTNEEIDYARYCHMEGIPFKLLKQRDIAEIKKEEKEEEKKPIDVPESVRERMDWVNN